MWLTTRLRLFLFYFFKVQQNFAKLFCLVENRLAEETSTTETSSFFKP